MGFARPSLRDLVTRAIADISARTQGSAFIKRSVERVLASVQAGIANGLHGHFEWLQRQALPTTADIGSLLGWGVWLKVPRKSVVQAAGTADFAGTVGTPFPVGTQMQSADGIVFATTLAATVDVGGNVSPPIAAILAGASGNLDQGAGLQLVSPIAGINSNGVVGVGGTTGGQDIEDTEDYRPRILDNLRLPPAGGGTGDYVAWAREVSGVTRAWEYGNLMGYGTVSLSFVMDDRATDDFSTIVNIIPTQADVDAVQDHIDAVRPLDMRAVYVRAPVLVGVSVTVSIKPFNDDVKNNIRLELKYLFLRESDLGEAMSQSKVDEAISTAVGEEDHKITTISSLDPGPWGLLTLGSIGFNPL
jgi:uncharacterized phage protein gp47/JayE